MTEERLIHLLKEGDPAACRELFNGWKDRVFTIALGFLPDREDAEDICQEVFMEVFRSVQSFRGEAKLSTWLYRVTVNKSLALIRSRKAKKRFGSILSLLPGEGPQIKDNRVFNHPGLNLENKEKGEVLYKALARLPDNQRIAFTLSQVDGLSYDEVCETMHLSKSSVESLIFRARKNLRKRLKDFYEKNS